ncbi:SidA/IucD/PvdA family monooxygenase [Photobacterium galatheae]|uniref:Pyridine nucleotide-disulfide oxidoreductase n=1 Tax=Photobacterium galatheae TaxID=1654360 RepID=A0A066RL78_9GAMM|nr:SidA/IucD/PvdA family monooxygenase [Photobacterium galatheae]KDM89881.1 hypothetical protein EA58_20745 [Photobacterium galatheae]MCM0151175.1 SidA/IucD/PvdA family monooxygenase [Photobacterium galatheae]
MNKNLYDVVMCGAGPANTSLIPDIIENEEIKSCLILEKTNVVGSGELKKYQITANSLGCVFLEKFDDCDRALSQHIRATEAWKYLSDHQDKAVELKVVGEYLEKLSEFIQEDHACCEKFTLMTEAEVCKVKHTDSGVYEITYRKGEKSHTVIAKKVLFNIGGKPRKPRLIPDIQTVNSSEIINCSYDEAIQAQKMNRISILGSSHSAVSCMIRLIEQLNYQGNIDLLVNKDFKLFYDSPESATADGYKFSEEDMCLQSKRINRYSGLRYDSFSFAQKLNHGHYPNIHITNIEGLSDEEIIQKINRSDLLVNCTGYESKLVNIVDQNDTEVEFEHDRYGLITDSKLSPILKSGQSLLNFHTFGLGSGVKTGGDCGGESNFDGRIDGVWVYQHIIPKIVFSNELK